MAIVHDVVVSELVKLVLKKLSSTAFTEIGLIFRVKGELKRLENTLIAINAVLLDAEDQQFTNNSVRIWLLSLKDVVYDIEDLLDLISTEDLERKFKKTLLFVKLFSYNCFAQELKAIRGKLDEIAENRRNYSFQDNRALTMAVEHRETCSLVVESHTFGREHEKEWIISHLLHYSVDDDAEQISVIPIIGIGGMGKTTLAQLVFNDSRVIQRFQMRLWVYVSKKFVLKYIIAKIIQSVNGEDFSNLSMEALRKKLQAVLADKTFLLVLDDVWNYDSKQWIELKNMLMLGGRSMIIVTTREDKVAVVTGTTKPLKLKDLPQYHCWSIFVKHAFNEGEEEEYPLLVKLGKSIVGKCGVPLAVKTLASFLRYERDDRTWKRVSESKLWEIYQRENDILPVLKLSLDHTPYQLRSCFIYCSLFRKGVQICRTDIINMWMAHKLVSLRVLKFTLCPNLVSLPENIGSLISLRVLVIRACKELISLPNSMSLISQCEGLRSLPEGLIRCTCLLKLQVYNCPNLRCLPKGFDNLKALQELRISGCPELSCRCQDGGDDWNLVCNVPEIYIDDIVTRTRCL